MIILPHILEEDIEKRGRSTALDFVLVDSLHCAILGVISELLSLSIVVILFEEHLPIFSPVADDLYFHSELLDVLDRVGG